MNTNPLERFARLLWIAGMRCAMPMLLTAPVYGQSYGVGSSTDIITVWEQDSSDFAFLPEQSKACRLLVGYTVYDLVTEFLENRFDLTITYPELGDAMVSGYHDENNFVSLRALLTQLSSPTAVAFRIAHIDGTVISGSAPLLGSATETPRFLEIERTRYFTRGEDHTIRFYAHGISADRATELGFTNSADLWHWIFNKTTPTFLSGGANISARTVATAQNPSITLLSTRVQDEGIHEVTIPGSSLDINVPVQLYLDEYTASYLMGPANLLKHAAGHSKRVQLTIRPNPPPPVFEVVHPDTGSESLIAGGAVGQEPVITNDPARLASGGYILEHSEGDIAAGVVSDGDSQLVLRFKWAVPGTMKLRFAGAEDGVPPPTLDPRIDGKIGRPGKVPGSGEVEVGINHFDAALGRWVAAAVFHAPSMFSAADDAISSRIVHLKAEFTGFDGETGSILVPIAIHRPPLVVMHGVMSSRPAAFGAFEAAIRQQIPDLYIAGPSYPNTHSFDQNRYVLRDQINELKLRYWQRGIVMRQADVIGHSMGGVLSRRWAADQFSAGIGFRDMGDINKLVTLDSPHDGAWIALVPYIGTSRRGGTLGAFIWSGVILISGDVFAGSGAFLDLLPGSNANEGIRASPTDVPCHVVIGDTTLFWDEVCADVDQPPAASAAACFMSTVLDDYIGFVPIEHDLAVSVQSQSADMLPPHTSTFDHWHSGATSNERVVEKCLQLLRADPGDQSFRIGFPTDPAAVSSHGADEGGDIESASAIAFTSPSSGVEATGGSLMPVLIEWTAGAELTDVLVGFSGSAVMLSETPFAAEIEVPVGVVGTVSMTAIGRHADGSVSFAEVPVVIQASSELVEITSAEESITLVSRKTPQRFSVTGHYLDGCVADLSSPHSGTVYASQDETVATVDEDGWVWANGSGSTMLLISHGGESISREVLVELIPEPVIELRSGEAGIDLLVGESREVSFEVSNSGSDDADGCEVAFRLPDGLSAMEVGAVVGEVMASGNEVFWRAGSIAAGQSVELRLQLGAATAVEGMLHAIATSGSSYFGAGGGSASVSVRVFDVPDFTLDLSDGDSDGIGNLIEYELGLDAFSPDELPFRVENDGNSSRVTWRVKRNTPYAESFLEESPDLLNWRQVEGSPEVLEEDPDFTSLAHPVVSDGIRKFYRLCVMRVYAPGEPE